MKVNGAAIKKKCWNRRDRSKKLNLQQRYDRVILKCTIFLVQKLTFNNCIDTILFANKHKMYELVLLSASFINKNFEMVFSSDEFIELEAKQLFTLLPLLVYNEVTKDNMENIILFWSKYKRAKRKKHIDDLLL